MNTNIQVQRFFRIELKKKDLVKEGLPHGGNLLLQGIASHSHRPGSNFEALNAERETN